ncbi:hypothetical protein FOZ63_018894, partial [Perkinsus olseni]
HHPQAINIPTQLIGERIEEGVRAGMVTNALMQNGFINAFATTDKNTAQMLTDKFGEKIAVLTNGMSIEAMVGKLLPQSIPPAAFCTDRIDIYHKRAYMTAVGGCDRNDMACFDAYVKRFRFYLAFENSKCRWYMTEKLWKVYKWQ